MSISRLKILGGGERSRLAYIPKIGRSPFLLLCSLQCSLHTQDWKIPTILSSFLFQYRCLQISFLTSHKSIYVLKASKHTQDWKIPTGPTPFLVLCRFQLQYSPISFPCPEWLFSGPARVTPAWKTRPLLLLQHWTRLIRSRSFIFKQTQISVYSH